MLGLVRVALLGLVRVAMLRLVRVVFAGLVLVAVLRSSGLVGFYASLFIGEKCYSLLRRSPLVVCWAVG